MASASAPRLVDDNSLHFEGLVAEKSGKLKILRFSNPKKKNALNASVYDGLAHHLKQAAEDPNITVVVITGTGDFYCNNNYDDY